MKKILLIQLIAFFVGTSAFAQTGYTSSSTTHYYNDGVNANIGGNASKYTVTQSGGTIVINANTGATNYDPITIDVLDAAKVNTTYNANPAGSTRRRVILMVSANPALTGSGNQLRIDLKGGSTSTGYVTDGGSKFVDVTTTSSVATVSFNLGDFKQIYSGTGCTPTTPCFVDSTAISQIQINPAAGSSAGYTGVITIDYIYAGDSTCIAAPTASTNGGTMTIANAATATLNGSVTNATGGTWSSPSALPGTFAPNANTLNATYTPSASERTAGTVTLTLTTTGNGAHCTAATATETITISAASGITNAYINANINLYPNPTTGLVKVENNSTFTVTGVSVVNPAGSEVFSQNGDLKSVDLGNLNKGIYFMKVETNGGSLMKKIVLE
jgi:hypothetical protein